MGVEVRVMTINVLHEINNSPQKVAGNVTFSWRSTS